MKSSIALCLGLSLACMSGAWAAPAESPEAAAPAAQPASSTPYFLWTDNSLTLLPYGWGFEVDPAEQSTLTFEHAHASRLGDLFLFVDFVRFHGTPSGADDSTWYGEISPRLSLGKVFDAELAFGPIKDVLVAGTYERGEDADVAEAVLVCVGFDLDVGQTGFRYAQVNIYGRNELTEYARDGFRDVQVTMVAARPFAIGKARFLADGYFDWVLGLGSETWNYHLNPQVSLDVGNLWGTPDKLFAGVELDFWWNKYQIPNTAAFDTNQTAISLMVKYHL